MNHGGSFWEMVSGMVGEMGVDGLELLSLQGKSMRFFAGVHIDRKYLVDDGAKKFEYVDNQCNEYIF